MSENLTATIAELLMSQTQMCATAESCTGGLVSATLTERPGSSAWYDRGFTTYSNAAKQELLSIPAKLINEHGAVSEQVAKAMAEGAIMNSTAQYSLSITGIAGPAGGSALKPVGTVCFAWAGGHLPTKSVTHQLSGDRFLVRQQAISLALEGLIKHIKQAQIEQESCLDYNYFLALRPQKASRQSIVSTATSLIDSKKSVHFDDLHLTLAYFGKVSPLFINNLKALLAKPCPIGVTFFTIDQLNTFSKSNAYWLGATIAPTELQKFYDQFTTHLNRLGYKKERRQFIPHITIGRKLQTDIKLPHTVLPLTIQFDELILAHANPDPNVKPRYKIIACQKL